MANAYTIAVLLDHFHLTLDEVANLTDWQIRNLYFAKRKKSGEIEAPKEVVVQGTKPTEKKKTQWEQYFDDYNGLMMAYSSKLISKEDYERSVALLKARYSHLKKSTPQAAPPLPQQLNVEDARTRLQAYLANGILTQQQFDEAIAKLQR